MEGTGAAVRPGSSPPFVDRADAGRVLAEHVPRGKGFDRAVVVALPRGGVPVAAEVARALAAPLMVMPVGKIGAPGQEELAVGAVAPNGILVFNNEVVAGLGLSQDELGRLAERATGKVAAQMRKYHEAGPPDIRGRSVIIVDDGLATGATMSAALVAVRSLGPTRVMLAVPVAPPTVLAALAHLVDNQVCTLRPAYMQAVGSWYQDFAQTTDDEVLQLLAELGPPTQYEEQP